MAKIETNSGKSLDLFNPDPSLINLNDIALGLSRQSRFAGQCQIYYSVAEHSLLSLSLARGYLDTTKLSPGLQKASFMHDAHEAYIRDLPSPLKKHFPGYEEISSNLDRAIEKKFSLIDLSLSEVKNIDRIALSVEAWRWMPALKENWTSPLREEYKGIDLPPLDLQCGLTYNPNTEYGPDEIYEMFLLEAEAVGLE